MRERDEYLAGVPCWLDVEAPDPAAAAAFYGGLFGWALEDAGGGYLMARLDGSEVAAIAPGARAAWRSYVAVERADDTAARAVAAGGRILAGPSDLLGAGRVALLADPSGAAFGVWEARALPGARIVNAPGTWNWSVLNTGDVDAAIAFYGELFGWDAGFRDPSGAAMFRRPGYGDFLDGLEPGVRERHESAGAPAGFTDAVAWLAPADGAPLWSVTFSVADADASAARAAELGGEVVVPPVDEGVVRMAVVRDPGGAAFTVSQFMPERLAASERLSP